MIERNYTMHPTRIAVIEKYAAQKGHFTAFGAPQGRRLRWDVANGEAEEIEGRIIERAIRPMLAMASAVSTFTNPQRFLAGDYEVTRKRSTWTISKSLQALADERTFWTERCADSPERDDIAIVCTPSEELVSRVANELFDPTVITNLGAVMRSAQKSLISSATAEGKLIAMIMGGGLSKVTFFAPADRKCRLARLACNNAMISIRSLSEPDLNIESGK